MSNNSNDGDLMVMNNYGDGDDDDDDDDDDGKDKDGIMFSCTIEYNALVSHLIYVQNTSRLHF